MELGRQGYFFIVIYHIIKEELEPCFKSSEAFFRTSGPVIFAAVPNLAPTWKPCQKLFDLPYLTIRVSVPVWLPGSGSGFQISLLDPVSNFSGSRSGFDFSGSGPRIQKEKK